MPNYAAIDIGSNSCRLKIARVEGDVVKVGIEAPRDCHVHRQEVYEEIQRSNQQALTRAKAQLPKLPMRPMRPVRSSPGGSPPNAP